MKKALYLYGLTLWKHHATLENVLGEGIKLLKHAGLVAVCRPCQHNEFDHTESGSNADTSNRLHRSLLEQIKQHEIITQNVISIGSFFPARFATLYSTETALLNFMYANHKAMIDFLESSEGYKEWAIKGYIQRTQAKNYLLAKELEAYGMTETAPGKRYVKEKQIALEVEKQLTPWLQMQAEKVMVQLQAWGTDCIQRPLPAATQSEYQGECFGNWAFLLADDQVSQVQQTLAQANQTNAAFGLSFVCTGPWALYSFSQQVAIHNVQHDAPSRQASSSC